MMSLGPWTEAHAKVAIYCSIPYKGKPLACKPLVGGRGSDGDMGTLWLHAPPRSLGQWHVDLLVFHPGLQLEGGVMNGLGHHLQLLHTHTSQLRQ